MTLLTLVDLSKQLIPEAESHSLGKLARSLGIPMSDRHRANGDALATLKLFKLLLNKDSEKKIITEVIREETHGELSPTQLDMVFNLPSDTGVYYMHDKDGDIIFIGKTKNIHSPTLHVLTGQLITPIIIPADQLQAKIPHV